MKLTFGELVVGDMFIGFPTDGDDSGHGGYRGGYNLFEKITMTHGQMQRGGSLSEFPAAMHVIKVIA